LPYGEANQNLVSKSEDEMEERAQNGQYECGTLSIRPNVPIWLPSTVYATAIRPFGHIGGDV